MVIKIKPQVIEWIMDELGYNQDEAMEFAHKIVAVLILSGAFGEVVGKAADEPPDAASIKARWAGRKQ